MSDTRSESLTNAMQKHFRTPADVARAICEHLGIDHGLVGALRADHADDSGTWCADEAADAFSALLEAAGITEDGG